MKNSTDCARAIAKEPRGGRRSSSALQVATSLVYCAAVLSTQAYAQSGNAHAQAEQALRSGRYQAAAEDYAKLVKQHPQSAELWSNLGAVHAMGGNCEQALPALEKARSLNSGLFTPWYFSGFCHLQFHANQRALGELRRAATLDPRDANAWYFLGQAARNLDQLGEAFDAVVRSLALDAQRPDTCYAAGKISLELAMEYYGRLQPAPSSSALVNRLEGERDAAQGVWEAAIEAYRKAAKLAPFESDIHYLLGTACLKARKFQEGEAAFRRCLEVAPKATLCRLGLSQAMAGYGAKAEAKTMVESAFLEHLVEPGDAAVALSVRFLVVSDPSSGNLVAAAFRSPVQYREFRAALVHDDILGVAKIMARRARQTPSEPDQLFVFGETFHWLSYRFYEKLENEFPDSTSARMLRAESLSTAGQQNDALEIYRALLAQNGPSIDLLQAIAQVYWTQGKWDDALKTLQDLMHLDPRDATIYVNAGRVYAYRRDLANAELNFQQAAQVDPGMFEAHLGLGETYRREGRDEDALRELQAAVNAEPANPRPHYELGLVYRKLARKDLAQKEMETFQRLQARSPAASGRRERKLVPLDRPANIPSVGLTPGEVQPKVR